MKKGYETETVSSEDSPCSRLAAIRDTELLALARIYERAIERYEQKPMADESPADTNTTKAERGDGSGEVRPAEEGGE